MAKLLKIIMEDMSQDVTGAKPSDKDGVTYNEGDGRQDTVVMTGPLSNAFTKALNLYFAKKEIGTDEGEELLASDSASVAAESMAIDAMMKVNLANLIANKENNANDMFVNLVSDKEDIVSAPSAIVMSTNISDALKPEVVDLMEAHFDLYKDVDKEIIVFVGPDMETDSGLGNTYVELDNKTDINMTNAGDTFKRATEAFYTNRGMKVVVGFESLIDWLKTGRKVN